MSDPKGTYYSPQESGWATVLRPGPNFLGMAQQQQALAAKKEQLALQQQAKMDAEREKQINKIAADMGNPVPTAFPWQEETNSRLKAGLDKIQKMYLENKPISEIRFEAERTVADVVSYGNAAKQVFAEANCNVKKLGKEYKQDEVLKLVASKFVGKDGNPIDARKADWEDINPEKAIFESPEPWNYLDENLVVKGFLNNPAFQEHAMLVQKKLDTGELGRFYKVGTTTTSSRGAGKIYSIDPMTGASQISDADTLIENGAFDMMLGDRKMLAVVDKYVNQLTSDRLTPLDEDQKDIMRAGVLADLLEKRAPGPSTIQRINEKYMPKYVGTGRLPARQTQSEKDGQRIWASSEDWWNSLFSSDVSVRAGAARFLDEDKLKPIIPGLGKDETIMDIGMRPGGVMTVRTESKAWDAEAGEHKVTGHTYEVDVNARKEALLNAYSKTSKLSKRYYGTDESGNKQQQNAPQQPSFQPGFLNKPK